MFKHFTGLAFIISLFSVGLQAQNYVNSPYSRYGIGDLINTGFSYNQSMGGASIALRPRNQVNYLNPASYTSQDTMSFLFQAGFSSRISQISTGFEDDRAENINIEYLALAFPATKWLNFSLGLTPYSRIQYLFQETLETGEEVDNLYIDYKGHGGFNEFFIGTSFTIKEILSFGINSGYLFGSLEKIKTSYISGESSRTASIEYNEDYIANDFYFKFGLQLHPTIKEKHHIVLGFTYDTDSKVKVTEKNLILREFPLSNPQLAYEDTLNIENLSGNFNMPPKYAFGLSYNLNNQYIITGEYITQAWEPLSSTEASSKLKIYKSYRFGAEINPAPLNIKTRQKYLKRMHYRFGGHYTETYLNVAGQNINSYGVSIGLGFPWRDSKKMYSNTAFNLSYQFGVRGTTDSGLIKENYHIITLGFTLYDFWFMKPKYD